MINQTEFARRQALLGRLALLSAALVLIVVVSSAYLRLTNAGLGCDDWPQCYGQLRAVATATPAETGQTFVRLTHRLAAMIVSILNLLIAYLAWVRQPRSMTARVFAIVLVGLTVFLSLLGRATTGTHLPIVTMGNLLGGLAMLALLWWAWLASGLKPTAMVESKPTLARWVNLNLVLVIAQITLGALISARYAGPSCSTFPACNGLWWPSEFALGDLNPLRGVQHNPDGYLQTAAAMVALNMIHRMLAVLTVASVMALGMVVFSRSRVLGSALFVTATSSFALGVVAVISGFSLSIVLAHNASAAMLLVAVLYGCYRLRFA